MDLEKIKVKVANRIPKPMDVKYRYAVLVPMIWNNNQWELIYEVRAKTLKRQPGEISFPGGELEKGETYEKAAIRETVEELNIDYNSINLIGELDYFVSYHNSTIHAFLATIDGVNVDNIIPNKDEVDHIFTVPVKFFMENQPKVYYLDLQTEISRDFPYSLIPNGENYNWRKGKHSVYFYRYKDYVIWGYTAKMTNNFIDIIKGH